MVLAAVAHTVDAEPLRLRVAERAVIRGVLRAGVNLGTWSAWGADQLMANILKNPGFEGTIDRAVVRVSSARDARFSDDDAGLARPDGFWIGGTYDVRTGEAAGRGGTVVDSRARGFDGLPQLRADAPVHGLAPGDVVVLTRVSDDGPPSGWTVPAASGGRVRPALAVRTGSPGRRSLSLEAHPGAPAEIVTWLDSIGDRAGKMLPLDGPWRLSVWARGETGAKLTVSVKRVGARPFVEATVAAGASWTEKTFDFEGPDSGPATPLEVRFTAREGPIQLDDVSLSARREDGSAFRPEVHEVLSTLRPGLLRDWQGQLGDTLENRLALPYARRTSRYRSTGDADFGYSIPEVLELCRRTGAKPWIVAPPVFSDEEWRGLGRFLASSARDLGEVVVEVGNENWNPTFRAGSVADPAAHGALAERGFRLLREAAGGLPVLRLAVNGPHVDPDRALAFSGLAEGRDLLAVAPYVLHSLAKGLPPARRLDALFEGDGGRLARIAAGLTKQDVELAVAEVNVHALGGDATAQERRPIVAGAVAGTAVARRLLEGTLLGAKRQCVWSLAEYETFTSARALVPLFGVVRDLGPTRRLRPSGLALSILNAALPGDAHRVDVTGGSASRDVTAVAFRSPAGWSVVAASAGASPVDVEVSFPAEGRRPTVLLVLRAATPLATNEDAEEVTIGRTSLAAPGGVLRFTVPERGLAAAVTEGRRD
jgi:hypothetical protein